MGAESGARETTAAVRTLVVWCPDWPVVAACAAAGAPAHTPAAVLVANRVAACSATARAEGVGRGLRKREAQARCPHLLVFDDDPDRDARLFEPVAAAVEELAPGVEVVRPGLVAVPARGPAGYFGGEEAAAERIVDHVAARAGAECQVGVADGLFAATLAARRGALVPAGGSADFLAPLGVHELLLDEAARPSTSDRTAMADLVDLLRRLGLRTLGAFAAVPAGDVASRFGAGAVLAHRLAAGLEERPPGRRRPPPEVAVDEELDPPVERVDAAAFAARALAERLHARLARLGLACTRLRIEARTGHGEELARVWRCAGPLTATGTADRVRWQLDGWLTGRGADRPTAGVVSLRLEPEEVVGADALQLDLFRGETPDGERAARALVRVQGLLGPDAVLTPVLGGGRGPADRVRWVPWGEERRPALDPEPPWPGRLPPPSPTLLPERPTPVEVLDGDGQPVGVTGRHMITARPAVVRVAGEPPRRVLAWAGPWPAHERWWVAAAAASGPPARAQGTGDGPPPRRVARLQVVLADGGDEANQVALLLARETGQWWVEGRYD
ncbi:protein ImuB [Streptoalloteichus tenebrarius]|uniref:Protein ImuB n=1 Tax=Streptoalloteichus tenebrarius (strain ATCC 17920 / DSM 40477 / JCM 4838 / CBS 697.72 / NBRC 16177 / NCIMB 11028 / NRRL B-12390 / A12253. 1 / ISP 5477) TaxID=1933 RepID=A0ABT1I1B9_STRSD|nr:DNA polymerase Y family protein [Streptoalloteichus tenebrarius]MCP2261559.1 protein ImuB [Streptoalloteichus tenebrarius]BFF02665.1 DNA polymerase Y family protein [Streptoalloteichus tenebrarius]